MLFVSLIFLSPRLWFVLVVAAESRDRRRIQKKVNSVDLAHKVLPFAPKCFDAVFMLQ